MANFTINLTGQANTSTTNTGGGANTNVSPGTTNVIATPNSGVSTIGQKSVAPSNIIVGVGVFFAIIAVICWSIYLFKKKRALKSISRFFFFVFITALTFAGLVDFKVNANNSGGNTSENALTVSVDDFYLEIEPTKNGTFGYGASTVRVAEATGNGYTLGVYTTTPDLVNKNDNSYKISRVNGYGTTLDVNTWGIASTEPTDETSQVWSSLSTDGYNTFIIKDVDSSTSARDESTIYFGVKVNDELATGEYNGTIVYTAVSKTLEPPAPSP